MEEIEVGSLVQLKSGGPSMTVVGEYDGEMNVKWFDQEGQMQEDYIPKAALKLC